MNSENRMPILEFLDKFNLGFMEYMNLAVIPYPIVTEDGNILYYNSYTDNLFLSDCQLNDPEDLKLKRIHFYEDDLVSLLYDLYIDFNIYDPSLNLTDSVFRYNSSKIDRPRFIDSTYSKVETTRSSIMIDIINKTGKVCGDIRNKHKLDRYTYSFNTFDLVNKRDPILDYILEDKVQILLQDNKLVFSPKQNFNSTSSGDNMSTLNSAQTIGTNTVVQNVIDKNKESLLIAAKLEVGGLALNLITEQIVKQLPQHFQFLLQDNPLIKVAISNLVNVVVQSMNIQDARILAVNDAMITASWIETVSMFNFQEIINTALSKLPESKVSTLVSEVQA